MKLTILLLTAFLHLTTWCFSQQVSLAKENISLQQVFSEIKKQTGYSASYKKNLFSGIKPVSIKAENMPLRDFLDLVLKDLPFKYSIAYKTILLSRKVAGDESLNQHPGGLLDTTPQQLNYINVKGRIIDEKGNPFEGITVTAKGTTKITASKVTGEFELKKIDPNSILVFSGVQIEPYELNVNGRPELPVIPLKTKIDLSDEIIVTANTGYQEIKRERMTGSYTTIKGSEIHNKGILSMDEILVGSVPGLNAVPSGRPGQDAKLLIRGVNSLTGNTDPTWIVDGMPLQGEIPNIRVGSTDLQSTIFTTGIGNIIPEDIESITILKDAAATAIYGARAANGVIVVKTKSGRVGRTVFNVNVNYGLTERPVNNIQMMNTAQKIKFEKDVYNKFGDVINGRVSKIYRNIDLGILTSSEADAEIAKLSAINTDWYKVLFRQATTTSVNFSMSGGSEKTQHFVSLSYMKEDGTNQNNSYDRLGMNINLTHNPSDKIRITGGLMSTLKNDRATASNVNPLEYAMFANPYERPYNDDGTPAADLSYNTSYSVTRPGFAWPSFNILDDLNRNTNTSRYLDVEVSLKLEYEFLSGLMFTSHGVFNANSNHNRITEGKNTYTNFMNNWFKYDNELDLNQVNGSLREATAYSTGYTFRNTLQYTKDIRQTHFIQLFGGQEISNRESYNSFNYSPVFDEEHRIIGFPEMTGINPTVINYLALGGTGKAQSKLSSFFSNISYSYRDRYVVTGAIRYDGSDIIGNENQFTPLWNVGARWNLHNENFLKAFPFIDELSLHGGFGYTGSIDKNAFPFVLMTLGQSIIYDGQTVPTSFAYPNPNIKWQTKKDRNIGASLALLQRRIEIGVNYYDNITRDVLDLRALPYSSGRRTTIENVADLLNKGWEFDVGITPVRNKNLQWFVRANFAVNRNKVMKTYYKSLDDLPLLTESNANAFVEGYPASAWFGYWFAGVNPANGNTLIYDGKGELFDMELLSSLSLNLAGPQIHYLGEQNPPYVGGFTTTVNFYRFIFSTSFEFKAGHLIPSFNTFRNIDSKNRHVSDANRWQQPGDITNIPAVSTISNAYSKYMYDVRLEKGDYLRNNFTSLGYNVNNSTVKKLGLNSARFTVTCKDLLTFSRYKGIDPALMGSLGYPNTRKYTFTMNITF